MSYEEVLENIKKRDKNDMEKEVGALKIADDAIVIDTTNLTIKEQEKIASILSEVDKKIEEYENKKQKLEKLKKGLMQQLLTGMIRVTV